MKVEKNKVVATRELYLDEDRSKKIKVEILQPQLSEDGLYRCEFRIEGAPEDMSHVHVGGVDSYQALCLTFRTVANVVDIYNKKYCNGKLRWMDEQDLEFHFTTKLEK